MNGTAITGSPVECRLATSDDWDAIWPIFAAVVRSGESYMYPPDITESAARSAWMVEPPTNSGTGSPATSAAGPQRAAATFVATIDGTVVATALLKPNQPGLGNHVANGGWMVDPACAGRGVGRSLAEHVIEAARSAGYRSMQFNAVVSTNTRAIGLWRSLGFAVVGTVPNAFRHVTHGLVDIHIMHREF